MERVLSRNWGVVDVVGKSETISGDAGRESRTDHLDKQGIRALGLQVWPEANQAPALESRKLQRPNAYSKATLSDGTRKRGSPLRQIHAS